MIEKVRIQGYRKFRDLTFAPKSRLNIFVGDNESGKSTLLEAITLALTSRVNGRPAQEELNPYWFNRDLVEEFFQARAKGQNVSLPTISIELFLCDADELQRMHGAHNSEPVTHACPGIRFVVRPNPEYANEIEKHVQSDTSIIPVEYYLVDWRSFADEAINARPKELSTALIDSRTIRSSSGIDYHLRQMLGDHLEPEEKAAIALAYRSAKEQMTTRHLDGVNKKMAELEGGLRGETLALAMDQSSRTAWDSHITPHVAEIPFAMAGQGQQAAVKIAIAMGRRATSVRIVMVEEPENHLSHTSLNRLMKTIESQITAEQQLLIATHSSFVLNRLGLDNLLFVSGAGVSTIAGISAETITYFRKLPGFDTLRIVLAERVVLLEGPSDEIVFERFYVDKYGRRPIEDGVDLVSMRSLSIRRFLELGLLLKKRCAAVRDCDTLEPAALQAELKDFLDDKSRKLFVGSPECGKTLEPQLIKANDAALLRKVLKLTSGADLLTWMTNNKTEAAIRIADAADCISPPGYILEAIDFIHGDQ